MCRYIFILIVAFSCSACDDNAMVEWMETKTNLAGNSIRKSNLKDQVVLENIGVVIESTHYYDQAGKEVGMLNVGDKIKAVSLRKRQEDCGEGMILVYLPNDYGDFTSESGTVYIPARKIRWLEDEELHYNPPPKVQPLLPDTVQPLPLPVPTPKKDDDVAVQQPSLELRLGSCHYRIKSIRRTNEQLLVECEGDIRLEGGITQGKLYEGRYFKNGLIQGLFRLEFKDPDNAQGEIRKPDESIVLIISPS